MKIRQSAAATVAIRDNMTVLLGMLGIRTLGTLVSQTDWSIVAFVTTIQVRQIKHDGQITFDFAEMVSSPKIEIILFTVILICVIYPSSPCHHEGRFAVVTKRGAGCDGPQLASGDLHRTKIG